MPNDTHKILIFDKLTYDRKLNGKISYTISI